MRTHSLNIAGPLLLAGLVAAPIVSRAEEPAAAPLAEPVDQVAPTLDTKAAVAAENVVTLHEQKAEGEIGDSPKVSVSLATRYRYVGRTNKDFDSATDGDLFTHLAAGRLDLRFDAQSWSAVVRYQYNYTEAIDRGAQSFVRGADLDWGYVEARDGNYKWRIGRQPLEYGSKRLLAYSNGSDNFVANTNVGKSWDAMLLAYTQGATSVDLFHGRPGLMASKDPFASLTGVYASQKLSARATADAYLLRKDMLRSTGDDHTWTFGARPKWSLGKGLAAEGEIIGQTGQLGGKDHRAFAYFAQLSYAPPKAKALTLGLEYSYASGGDPADPSKSHTFDPMYASNYGRYSWSDIQGMRNLKAWTLRAQYDATKKLSLNLLASKLQLADSRDYWYGANGRPMNGVSGPLLSADGSASTDVGTEVGLGASYRLDKRTTLEGGYTHLFPGAFVRDTNGGRNDQVGFFYLSVGYRF